MAFMVAAACAEMVVSKVADAEANVGENKDSSGGVDGDAGGNIGVSSGSGDGRLQWQWGPKQGQRWQWQQQWLWQWQTTAETVGAGNNQQNEAAVAVETAVMAAAIMAARLQWQAGAVAAAWRK